MHKTHTESKLRTVYISIYPDGDRQDWTCLSVMSCAEGVASHRGDLIQTATRLMIKVLIGHESFQASSCITTTLCETGLEYISVSFVCLNIQDNVHLATSNINYLT